MKLRGQSVRSRIELAIAKHFLAHEEGWLVWVAPRFDLEELVQHRWLLDAPGPNASCQDRVLFGRIEQRDGANLRVGVETASLQDARKVASEPSRCGGLEQRRSIFQVPHEPSGPFGK